MKARACELNDLTVFSENGKEVDFGAYQEEFGIDEALIVRKNVIILNGFTKHLKLALKATGYCFCWASLGQFEEMHGGFFALVHPRCKYPLSSIWEPYSIEIYNSLRLSTEIKDRVEAVL